MTNTITEKTLLPISLVIAIMGAAMWFVSQSKDNSTLAQQFQENKEVTNRRIQKLGDRNDAALEALGKINQQLAEIKTELRFLSGRKKGWAGDMGETWSAPTKKAKASSSRNISPRRFTTASASTLSAEPHMSTPIGSTPPNNSGPLPEPSPLPAAFVVPGTTWMREENPEASTYLGKQGT